MRELSAYVINLFAAGVIKSECLCKLYYPEDWIVLVFIYVQKHATNNTPFGDNATLQKNYMSCQTNS